MKEEFSFPIKTVLTRLIRFPEPLILSKTLEFSLTFKSNVVNLSGAATVLIKLAKFFSKHNLEFEGIFVGLAG